MGGGLPDLLKFYMGGSAQFAETPKLYYAIYEQPLKSNTERHTGRHSQFLGCFVKTPNFKLHLDLVIGAT